MLQGMTWMQVQEWIKFSELEPFGPERADHRAAYIVATICNVHRKKGTKALTSHDVLQRWGDAPKARKPQMDWRHMKALAKMAAAAYNHEYDTAQAKKAGTKRKP